jgi:hypothetical protein
MKLRTLVITVALLAALSAIAFLRNRPEPAPAADPRVGKPLLDSETVGRAAGIVISDQGKKVELTRNADGTWTVPSYYGMPADVDKISHLVQDLNESKIDRFVTSNPDRVSRLDFKDSSIVLTDASGKEIWNLGFGKTPDSGNGRFVRFGKEPVAFFSGLHVWLDTDAKGWADPRLVTVKPDEIASVEIPIEGGTTVIAGRAKKGAAWTAPAPAGKKLVADKVTSLVTTLTSLRFTDTVDVKDPLSSEAAKYMRPFKLTTFDGKTLTVSLGRRPEEKKPKPAAPPAKGEPAADAKASADAAAEAKPVVPDTDTVPAGPVFATVSSSDAHAGVNDLMKRRAFEVDEYTFTGLPQKADDLFEAEKAK